MQQNCKETGGKNLKKERTRNKRDYKESGLQILLPEEAIDLLKDWLD